MEPPSIILVAVELQVVSVCSYDASIYSFFWWCSNAIVFIVMLVALLQEACSLPVPESSERPFPASPTSQNALKGPEKLMAVGLHARHSGSTNT